MRGVGGPDVEALHERLKHSLEGRKALKKTNKKALMVRTQTDLPLNGHGGNVLQNDVLHLSV